jgi:hypothetical protein
MDVEMRSQDVVFLDTKFMINTIGTYIRKLTTHNASQCV